MAGTLGQVRVPRTIGAPLRVPLVVQAGSSNRLLVKAVLPRAERVLVLTCVLVWKVTSWNSAASVVSEWHVCGVH